MQDLYFVKVGAAVGAIVGEALHLLEEQDTLLIGSFPPDDPVELNFTPEQSLVQVWSFVAVTCHDFKDPEPFWHAFCLTLPH